MRFEWDDAKNQANIRQHGLDFADAGEVFQAPLLVRLDRRTDYAEDRWVGIGLLRSRPVVVVLVFTERGADTIRIISMRKAARYERNQYQQAIQDGLGPP